VLLCCRVIKLSSFPSPATQAKSHIKHPVLDNERQRWVSLCDESAQTVQRVAISTVTQGWEYVDQQKGVIIMKKPSESGDGRSLNRVKGTAVIKAPPFFVISYIGHFEKSKQWNEMFDHGEIIEQITPSTRITHLAYKSVFPATARDFCVVSGIRQLDKHTFIHAASSVKHPKCGAEKSFVRAETMAGGFAIIRDERNLEQCSVTYTTCVDLKGRVPTFVINKVSTSQPMCVAVLRDLVERDYNTLRNEQKRKWQNMTLMNYLRRGETGGDDDIDAEAGEDVKSYDIVLEEDEKESEWMDASGQVTESSFDGSISISQTMSMEESVCAMPHDVDLPLTFESEIDYRTLGNQVCGDIMAEFLLAATVDLHSPKRQSSNGWMFQYVEKDVQILKKSLPNCKFNSFIGKGIINLPPAVVWAAVKDPQTRFVYDNMLKTLDIVERIEPGLMIVYTIHETANCFMKQARDLCYLHCEREDPSGKYIVAGRSVEHPKCPGKPSLVRAHAYPSGWQIEPLKQDGRTVSLVSCLVQVNLGGMVPSRLLNMVAKRQPLSVAYIREYLTSS
jgi:StAR-related lipid transfer protein 9